MPRKQTKFVGGYTNAEWAALRKRARAVWQAAHMSAWVTQERAKGRPEGDLTWGNCIRETGVLVTDAHGEPVADEHGIQRIDPSPGTLVPVPDSVEKLDAMQRQLMIQRGLGDHLRLSVSRR